MKEKHFATTASGVATASAAAVVAVKYPSKTCTMLASTLLTPTHNIPYEAL